MVARTAAQVTAPRESRSEAGGVGKKPSRTDAVSTPRSDHSNARRAPCAAAIFHWRAATARSGSMIRWEVKREAVGCGIAVIRQSGDCRLPYARLERLMRAGHTSPAPLRIIHSADASTTNAARKTQWLRLA